MCVLECPQIQRPGAAGLPARRWQLQLPGQRLAERWWVVGRVPVVIAASEAAHLCPAESPSGGPERGHRGLRRHQVLNPVGGVSVAHQHQVACRVNRRLLVDRSALRLASSGVLTI